MAKNTEKTYYTIGQVAEKLDVSVVTVRRYIKAKKIKGFYKLGNEWRIEKHDLENFIERLKS